MKLIPYFILGVLSLSFACQSKKDKTQELTVSEKIKNQPCIERLDQRLDLIIDPASKVEIIAEGFEWTEGPLWIDDYGLLFSDIPPNKIYKWTKDSSVQLYLTPSGYTGDVPRAGEKGSNALLLDKAGNLILCQHGDRRVARLEGPLHDPKPIFETITDNYQGKKLNSPNDACFDNQWNLYFTDPPYGFEKYMDDPLKELDFQGVYNYSKNQGLVLLTDELSRPNGIGLSPDEITLYVANSDPERAIWMAYELDSIGTIKQGRVFYDATSLVGKESGLPDGLKVDPKGNIFAAGPGGIWIFNAAGVVLGKIKTGQETSNCAFGEGGKTLFITADMYVMKVDLLGS